MKKIFFYAFLCSISIIVSCKKRDNIILSSPLAFMQITDDSNNTFGGDLGLVDKFLDFYNKSEISDRSGIIHIAKYNNSMNGADETSSFVNTYLGDLNFNNMTVTSDSKTLSIERQGNNFFFPKELEQNLNGKNILFNGVGSLGNWQDGFYVPQKLIISSPSNQDIISISKKNGFNISWNQDPNAENDKGVLIELTYENMAEKLFPNSDFLPSYDISHRIIVPDDGQYTLTPQDLQSFPTPIRGLRIGIYRGNYKASYHTGKVIPMMYFEKYTTFAELTN